MINSDLNIIAERGTDTTKQMVHLMFVMSIFSGQNIRKLRDMKLLTNEMKRS